MESNTGFIRQFQMTRFLVMLSLFTRLLVSLGCSVSLKS